MSWLTECRRLFEQAYGPAEEIVVSIRAKGQTLRLTIPSPSPHPAGSEIDQAILRAASIEPATPQKLARLAGYKCNSYFREAVTRLVRADQLRRTADGLSRAN